MTWPVDEAEERARIEDWWRRRYSAQWIMEHTALKPRKALRVMAALAKRDREERGRCS